MKASEYAAQFKATGSTTKALSDVVIAMILEVETIGKKRGIQTDAGLFSILNEIQSKWEAFVRQSGPLKDGSGIRPDGFEKMIQRRMIDIHEAWIRSRKRPAQVS